jgi:type I restriction enzyme S subunit
VQGKLGTQDAGDEPAGVLLKKIFSEKKRFVRGQKKEENFEEFPISEITEQYPNNWVLTRLIEVIDFARGRRPDELYETPKKYPYIDIDAFERNILKQYSDEENVIFCDNSNLIIVTDGSRSGLVGFGRCGILGSTLGKIGILGGMDKQYLYYFLKANYNRFNQNKKGARIPHLDMNLFRDLTFPLPPLVEQHRIVAKVDRLMILCDELEARQQKKRMGCLRLGTASLVALQNATPSEEFGWQWAKVCDEFDLILDCPENIERLRDSIVALACSGKLTEKWRTENRDVEPASRTLEKLIKDRKKKKFLKTNLKQHDFSEFPQIPDTWMWSTIEEVSERVTVGHVGPMMNEYRATGIPFLRSQNVRKNNFDEKGLVYISQEFHDILNKSKIEPGDLVVVRSGNVGVCCVIPDSLKDANCSDLVIIKQPFGFLPRFGAYYVNSISQTWVNSGKVGMALTHYNTKSVANIPIPLPPLAEQYRIVAKVDALMALCDELEARLKERAAVQGRFANAIVKEVGANNA